MDGVFLRSESIDLLLRGLQNLDQVHDSAFSDVASLAARACQAPIGMISIFEGEEIVFRAAFGLDWRGMRRAGSFCDVAGALGTGLLVDDAVLDERFQHAPLVIAAPFLRAYAGVPLIDPAGVAMGTVCAADLKPRAWTDDHLAVLTQLARMTTALMETRGLIVRSTKVVTAADTRHASDLRYRTVFNEVREGLVLHNARGEIIEANPSAARLLGLTEDQLLGRTPMDERWGAIRPDGAPFPGESHPAMTALSQGIAVRDVTLGIRLPDGERRWLQVAAQPIFRDDELLPHQVLTSFKDVGHARRTEEILLASQRRLEAALEAAERAAAGKSAVLSGLEAEIRTPLTGLMGLSTALAASGLSPAQEEMTALIGDCGRALERLLSDILDATNLEAGRLRLESIPFSPRLVIEGAVAALEPLMTRKGLTLVLDGESLGDEICLGDPGRLAQIVSTLMTQAISDAAEGALTVAASLSAPSRGRTRRLSVVVATNTPRAAPSPAATAQAARRGAGDDPGAGGRELARALAQDLVRLHGGEISLEASAGAPFAFWIPLTLATADVSVIAPDPKTAQGALSLLSILVAEDHPANRTILKTILEPFDITLKFAVDGRAAVDLYAEESFDLILMDSHMPVMDGLAAVMEIRRLERRSSRPRTPIAILSADIGPEHRTSVRRAGADAFISKPITAERLTAAIELLTGLRAR